MPRVIEIADEAIGSLAECDDALTRTGFQKRSMARSVWPCKRSQSSMVMLSRSARFRSR